MKLVFTLFIIPFACKLSGCTAARVPPHTPSHDDVKFGVTSFTRTARNAGLSEAAVGPI